MTNTLLTSTGYRTKNLEELRQFVPAAFATNHDPKRSSRYSFVETTKILEAFSKLGWNVFSGKQQGENAFSRHIIRLVHNEFDYMSFGNDRIKPQIILDNSHNGGSSAQLHLGLFRLVCSNGLIVSKPGMYTGIRIRHMGVNIEELIDVIKDALSHYNSSFDSINNMIETVLTNDQKYEFALKAIAYREPWLFIDNDGNILEEKLLNCADPNEFLKPIRNEDVPDNLWNTFNIIQEKIIKGLYERKSIGGRKSNPRELTNAVRNLQLNKILWSFAEGYVNVESSVDIKTTEGQQFTYISRKGKELQVTVVEKIDENQVMVQNIEGGLKFAANINNLF